MERLPPKGKEAIIAIPGRCQKHSFLPDPDLLQLIGLLLELAQLLRQATEAQYYVTYICS